jgi:hypothetical protein
MHRRYRHGRFTPIYLDRRSPIRMIVGCVLRMPVEEQLCEPIILERSDSKSLERLC